MGSLGRRDISGVEARRKSGRRVPALLNSAEKSQLFLPKWVAGDWNNWLLYADETESLTELGWREKGRWSGGGRNV